MADLRPYSGQGKLRYWCQKVLPAVYDDALSYYELLNKVVEYLNTVIGDLDNVEFNVTTLSDALTQFAAEVQERFDGFDAEVEDIVDQMILDGDFDQILSGLMNTFVAEDFSTTKYYDLFDYCIYDGKLYKCMNPTGSYGEWVAAYWRETNVCHDIAMLMNRVFALNAGEVLYDESETYDNGTVGAGIQDAKDTANSKLPLTGGILNGTLSIESAGLHSGTAPSSETYGKRVYFYDEGRVEALGYVAPWFDDDTDNSQFIRFAAARKINNYYQNNILGLGVDSSGNKIVYLSSPEAWLSALGLFEATITTTVNDVLDTSTLNSSFTVNSVKLATLGRIAMVYITFNMKADATPISSESAKTAICSLKSSICPLMRASATVETSASKAYPTKAYINQSGAIDVVGKVDAGQSVQISSIFLTPITREIVLNP